LALESLTESLKLHFSLFLGDQGLDALLAAAASSFRAFLSIALSFDFFQESNLSLAELLKVFPGTSHGFLALFNVRLARGLLLFCEIRSSTLILRLKGASFDLLGTMVKSAHHSYH